MYDFKYRDVGDLGLIGLSLSGCVLDIFNYNIPPSKVMALITRTDVDSPEQAWDVYKDAAWKELRDNLGETNVLKVLRKLWPRVVQPRKDSALVPVGTELWIVQQGVPGFPYKGDREPWKTQERS